MDVKPQLRCIITSLVQMNEGLFSHIKLQLRFMSNNVNSVSLLTFQFDHILDFHNFFGSRRANRLKVSNKSWPFTLDCSKIFFFIICMFYQVLGVPHSSSSTPTWGSVLPSIVETRDQNSRGCTLLFSNRNLGSFCA